MADNKLEGLSAAEARTGNDTVSAAECDEHVEAAREGDAKTDAPAPATAGADAEKVAAPTDQAKAAVTTMEPEKDQAAADKAKEPPAAGGTVLNAGSVDNRHVAPDAASQATGHSPATQYPAPTPTRDSAIHQFDIKVGELMLFLNDFDHQVDGSRQALIDAIRAYKPA